MTNNRLNWVIAGCVVIITATYLRSMRKLNKDADEFNTAMDEFVAQFPREEQQ